MNLRTERVVLEVTYDQETQSPPGTWDWSTMVLEDGESVRVVSDEPSSDAEAEVLRRALVASEIKRLKAESEAERLRKELEAASNGAESQGVSSGSFGALACDSGQGSRLVAASGGGEQPRGWLTEDEVWALRVAADNLPGMEDADGEPLDPLEGVFRNLLARSSPPEVQGVSDQTYDRTDTDFHMGFVDGWNKCGKQWRKAIVSAGVAVKEVGRE